MDQASSHGGGDDDTDARGTRVPKENKSMMKNLVDELL